MVLLFMNIFLEKEDVNLDLPRQSSFSLSNCFLTTSVLFRTITKLLNFIITGNLDTKRAMVVKLLI